MTTSSWNAVFAFRIRVSMSAMGSVIMSAAAPLPGCLRHAGHFARVHHRPQTDAAQTELLVDRTRAAATTASRVAAHRELRLALLLLDQGLLCHQESASLFSSARRDGTGNPWRAARRAPGRRSVRW